MKKTGVCAPEGFLAGTLVAGIKPKGVKEDVAVIYSEAPCTAAAVYTTNLVKADCLIVTKEHLEDKSLQAVIVNSGNANAAAPNGYKNASIMAQAAADALNLNPDQVAVSSTGVIGQELPVSKIVDALEHLSLSSENGEKAARAIMTTDTVEKTIEVPFVLNGTPCTMGAMAKGSGMIHPNMGTMLCFITTDAAIDASLLEKALRSCTKKTFNRITVDGDTSTNDMCLIMANGMAHNEPVTTEDAAYETFKGVLMQVMQHLAIAIAGDGEGASRLMTVTVNGADSEDKAETLARSVASSSLLKAAVFGADANWGRVICAMGYSGAVFDPKKTDIQFSAENGSVQVCENGLPLDFDEDLAKKILSEDKIEITADIHEGEKSATCWGCDLTYEYVKINGDYRS